MKLFWLLISLLIFGADMLVKRLVVEYIQLSEAVDVIPGVFGLTYVQNTGMSFSLFNNSPSMLTVITVLALTVSVVILIVLIRNKFNSKLADAALALILAGALGNAVDRLVNGHVVDMFEFLFVRFAIFNVADIALTFGTAMLAVWMIKSGKQPEHEESVTNEE